MLHALRSLLAAAGAVAAIAGCSHAPSATSATGGCDPSIKLPDGFCALVFAESAGPVRELVVRKNGDVIAGVLDQHHQPGGVLVLRDTNKDGHADVEYRFGDAGVHGVALDGDSTLYASTANAVLRYRLTDSLAPHKLVDTIVTGLAQRPIPSHTLAIDERGNLIVNIGAASDGCASPESPGVHGRDPCPDLDVAGGIWSFRPDHDHQQLAEGTRIATGLHNAVALAVSPHDTMVYAVSDDRDRLHDLWPNVFSPQDAATRPAEQMVRVASARADFGWPYCYYDFIKAQRFVAPEYGGDQRQSARCDRLIQPLIAFPAHWTPMSMLFYTGSMFPPAYRTGVFIAFHGSANRSPLPEEGYHVVYLQLTSDDLAGEYSAFATGFAGSMASPEGAEHRPVGLAQGPDGALYVSDDKGGRIWKILYKKR